MATKVTFDAVNKLIILDQVSPDGNGQVFIDVKIDLYSDAKEEWKTDVTLNKMRFPFRTTGGDPLGGGETAGAYFYLQNTNGWRIRPYEADHELIFIGNLFGELSTTPIIVPTLGNYTVMIKSIVSANTIGIVGGVDVTRIDGSVIAAQQLAKSTQTIVGGTVDNTTFTPTTTQFEVDDITETTSNHFKDRIIIFTSGALQNQVKDITAYSLQNSKGFFTCSAFTESPVNNDTFIIV